MALEQLKVVIDQSNGKWSQNISEIDYIFLKVATEYADNEEKANRLLESQLQIINIPEEGGSKRQWLKSIVCLITDEPETLKEVREAELKDAKSQLLTIILDRIRRVLPDLTGSAIRILEKAIVFLLKQAFKAIARGINNWCTI